MRRIGRSFGPVALASLTVALAYLTAAGAASASRVPGSTTQKIAGVPCSVTGSLRVNATAGRLSYSGSVSCIGGGAEETIDLVPQVEKLVGSKQHWYTISGSSFYQGPSSASPLRVSSSAHATAGHTYRLLAIARVVLADGSTGTATACAACGRSHPTGSLRGSQAFLSQPSKSALIRGSACSVTQNGLVFSIVNRGYVLSYGGFIVCPSTVARTSALSVCVQTASGASRPRWFTVSGSCVTTGSSSRSVLAADTARTAYLGHGYRIKATATVSYRSTSGTKTITRTVYSAAGSP